MTLLQMATMELFCPDAQSAGENPAPTLAALSTWVTPWFSI
jgi:hypothetical protein